MVTHNGTTPPTLKQKLSEIPKNNCQDWKVQALKLNCTSNPCLTPSSEKSQDLLIVSLRHTKAYDSMRQQLPK